MKNAKFISYSQQTYTNIIVKNLFLHLKWHLPIMLVNLYLKLKVFSVWLHPDSFSRGGECHRPWYWWERYPDYGASSLRQDTGVSNDRLVCHHPISRSLTASDGSKIQVRLRHVLREDPTISYVEYLTNLSNESWTCACGRYLEADLLQDPSELHM
jgi:hypothetical protein